jgi:argininosuccinate lyase
LRRSVLEGSLAGVVVAVTVVALLQALWQLCVARLSLYGGWRTAGDLLLVLPAFSGMVSTLTFNTELLESLAPMGYSLATDVAEWLVKQGVPFRDAHEITGQLVQFCEQNNMQLDDPTDSQLLAISKHLTPQVRSVIDIQRAISSRDGAGGTSLAQVDKQLEALNKVLAGEK